jgi:hypothetical protein
MIIPSVPGPTAYSILHPTELGPWSKEQNTEIREQSNANP